MEYAVTIARTTGKRIDEFTYQDLEVAREHFEKAAQTFPYRRVLILLMEKSDEHWESILDVYFVDGLSYW